MTFRASRLATRRLRRIVFLTDLLSRFLRDRVADSVSHVVSDEITNMKLRIPTSDLEFQKYPAEESNLVQLLRRQACVHHTRETYRF